MGEQSSNDQQHLRNWDTLGTDEQLAIREEYGHYLDSLPPTCSMDSKIERFARWLREQKGVLYEG